MEYGLNFKGFSDTPEELFGKFPSLTDQEKDRLLSLLLRFGTLTFTSDNKYTFDVHVDNELNSLDAYYGELILKAMNDIHSPI